LESITKFLPLIKDQITHNQRQSEKFGAKDHRYPSYIKRASEFTELYSAIEELKIDSESKDDSATEKKLSLTPKDLEGLPPELIAQLSTKVDDVESNILKILEDNGGTASLDHMLIGIYKISQEILQRNKLNSKVYRMINKGLIEGVDGKKAVYRIKED